MDTIVAHVPEARSTTARQATQARNLAIRVLAQDIMGPNTAPPGNPVDRSKKGLKCLIKVKNM